jgi:hypothetical protein
MALTIPVSEIVEKSSNRLLGKHESWGRVLLGDVATVLNGFAFKSSEFSNDTGMPLIRIRDVGKDSSETNYLGECDPRYIVEPDDLLVGMDGDFNCARWRGPRGLLNQRVCKITLKSDIYLPRFLDYTLPGYLKAINDVTSCVTVKHLSSKSIEEIPLPLPPKEVQERLVARSKSNSPALTKPSPISSVSKQTSSATKLPSSKPPSKANSLKSGAGRTQMSSQLANFSHTSSRNEGRSGLAEGSTRSQLLRTPLVFRHSRRAGRGQEWNNLE